MSLLEDVFLEDEANEAQELERVIEGGEYEEERVRSDSDDNSEKEDEAEEDKRRVDPASTKTKRVIKNPRFILNPARLTGPRGIQVIPDHFKDFKFKGKGHEKEDLDLVLKKLEHWAYRLYPKFQFEDCLKKIETLGKKRPVMVHLQKIRSDQFLSEETVVQKDSSDDETPQEQEDEFDKLLQQQIELARATPAPGSVKKNMDNSHIENRSLTMPKATSSPSISEEQRERMLRNRKLAEERRLARLKEKVDSNNDDSITKIDAEDNVSMAKKHTKFNVIDSSDDDDMNETEQQEITVDVHSGKQCKDTDKESMFDGPRNNSEDKITILDKERQVSTERDNLIEGSEAQDNIASTSELNNTGEVNNEESVNSAEEISNPVIRDENIVLENNIIQSTIQGLVENDNNLNLERDLINRDGGDGEIEEGNNEDNIMQNDNLMDVDFSEEF